MAPGSERAALKTAELIEIAAGALPGLISSARATAAAEVIGALATVTAPEEPPRVFRRLRSTKPGTILLDLRKLVMTAAGGALPFTGAGVSPWTAVLAGLVVWDTIWSGLKIDLTEREAVVVFTMWVNADRQKTVADGDLLAVVNDQCRTGGRAPLSERDLAEALWILEQLRCIRRSRRDSGRWWLQEWVSVDYR
ncbi:MAG TPA: hypothetical protein VNJ70_18485 [Thermoanaerobaculia bacterium]|nr:hypothetical protein [Thermoanaerobaculia bacterium]